MGRKHGHMSLPRPCPVRPALPGLTARVEFRHQPPQPRAELRQRYAGFERENGVQLGLERGPGGMSVPHGPDAGMRRALRIVADQQLETRKNL